MTTTRQGPARVRRRATAVATAAVVAVLAAGCGDDPDDSADDGSDPTTTPTSSSSAPPPEPTEPTEPAETTGSEPAPTEPTRSDGGGTDSPPARAQGSAIKAGALPGFNTEWTWTKDDSGNGPPDDSDSVCMVSSLTAIGATVEYHTEYDSDLDDDSWALVMTAVFPDELTVKRSEGILAGWLKGCAKQARSLGLKKVSVTPVRTVDTVVGAGQQRLVTYRPVEDDPDASWFQAEGFVRDGDTITYAIVATAGQDYNYERGAEPMDQVLQVAAKRLAKSRS
jgi:hypothetical protein